MSDQINAALVKYLFQTEMTKILQNTVVLIIIHSLGKYDQRRL